MFIHCVGMQYVEIFIFNTVLSLVNRFATFRDEINIYQFINCINLENLLVGKPHLSKLWALCKCGFVSEDTGDFLHCHNRYSKSLSWAENLNKLFTDLGGKFKFSAQDSDLEYLFWRCKNSPVSSDLKPLLVWVSILNEKLTPPTYVLLTVWSRQCMASRVHSRLDY